jgi:predicted nucleotidyltransferase
MSPPSEIINVEPSLPEKAAEYARILGEHLLELERDYGVASLALFGSYVRGEEQEGSDLDVLVDFSGTPSLLDLASLQRTLSGYVDRQIDLVPRAFLRGGIGARVLREAVEIEALAP